MPSEFDFSHQCKPKRFNAASTHLDVSRNKPPVTIGCGPGGMSFLHAVACRRKKLTENNDFDGLRKLPVVTCFERNSLPGGVWRSSEEEHKTTSNNGIESPCAHTKNARTSTNMYEGLWINGCKEALEYSDYTFDDHFKRAMPVFLPRSQVLGE